MFHFHCFYRQRRNYFSMSWCIFGVWGMARALTHCSLLCAYFTQTQHAVSNDALSLFQCFVYSFASGLFYVTFPGISKPIQCVVEIVILNPSTTIYCLPFVYPIFFFVVRSWGWVSRVGISCIQLGSGGWLCFGAFSPLISRLVSIMARGLFLKVMHTDSYILIKMYRQAARSSPVNSRSTPTHLCLFTALASR